MGKDNELLTGGGEENTTPRGVFTDMKGKQIWIEEAGEVTPGMMRELEELQAKRKELERLVFEIKLAFLRLKYEKRAIVAFGLVIRVSALRVQYAIIASQPIFTSGSDNHATDALRYATHHLKAHKENPLAIVGNGDRPEVIQKKDGTEVPVIEKKKDNLFGL